MVSVPDSKYFELKPLLAVKEMSAPLLSKAVVASVSNPRALSKILAALQNRSYHPVVVPPPPLTTTTTTTTTKRGDEDEEVNNNTTSSSSIYGRSSYIQQQQQQVERLMKFWGYTIWNTNQDGSDSGVDDYLSSSLLPSSVSLDHLKMIRKGSTSGMSEVLIGIVPAGEEEDDVAERAGMWVCEHIQSVLLLQNNGGTTASTATTTPLKASIGKKTQRIPVSTMELGSVFAGVSLAQVPNFSPIRRDNWNLANSTWPLTTPTPAQICLQATKADFDRFCLTPSTSNTPASTTIQQPQGNSSTGAVKNSDQLLALHTLRTLKPYADTFFFQQQPAGGALQEEEIKYCIAIVCRVDIGDVVSAVRMPLIGRRRCHHHTPSSSPLLPTPYAVDPQTALYKSTAGRNFLQENSSNEEKKETGVSSSPGASSSTLYDVDQTSMPPFFVHPVFEALRIASVRMYDRLTKQRQDKAASVTTGGGDDIGSVGGSGGGGSATSGGQMEYLCNGLDLITNVEPCTMCTMACVHSRLNRLLFLNRNVGGHGGVSGSITVPHDAQTQQSVTAVTGGTNADMHTTPNAFRIHCCSSLNHHFNTYEMQFGDNQ